MKKLIAIGEALIDFIPNVKGQYLKDVITFKRVVGGAPANVAGAVAKLGGKSTFLTKLGDDAFGHHIIEVLKESNIDTQYIKTDHNFDTSLAFVSLAADGNRDFKFYRRTAADLQFSIADLDFGCLENAGVLHFCSVDLVDSPMKEAHRVLIKRAKEEGVLISFDPNLRLSLWDNHDELKKTIFEFMPYADILKISDDELQFITGKSEITDALPIFFELGVKVVLFTKGDKGASIYLENEAIHSVGYKVDAVDTTGGGDSFIGAFLFKVLENQLDLSSEKLSSYIDFANKYAAYTVTKEGALSSMATLEEINKIVF